ncbi:unnamed protein product [Urochloa humidicola]
MLAFQHVRTVQVNTPRELAVYAVVLVFVTLCRSTSIYPAPGASRGVRICQRGTRTNIMQAIFGRRAQRHATSGVASSSLFRRAGASGWPLVAGCHLRAPVGVTAWRRWLGARRRVPCGGGGTRGHEPLSCPRGGARRVSHTPSRTRTRI